MPSTRKQRNKERRSRKTDIMSDAENVDVMLGSCSRNDEMNDQIENELNLDSKSSRPQRLVEACLTLSPNPSSCFNSYFAVLSTIGEY